MKLLDIATRIAEAPLNSWPGVLALTIVMLLFALSSHRIGSKLFQRLTRPYLTLGMVVRYVDRPAQLAVTTLLLQLVWWNAADDLMLINPLRRLSGLILIGSLTWLAVRSVAALVQGVVLLNPLDTEDNLRTRALHTQVHVLGRCVMGTIVVVGIGAMLMTIPNVRQIGTSLLASAGVAGLVAGIAARPVLGNLIAGLQIAISQPVRIDDVVVVQGEWGRVEAITGSYIAIRIWDQRRLIVPLQWFIENSFQNWTRNSAEIIGTVFLWVDFRLPLAPVRQELVRLCEAASEWDRRVQVLQVTDTSERAMQLRVLVSSPDSPRNFDLRCKVREGLLDFIQREFPDCLPRDRAEWHTPGATATNGPANAPTGEGGASPASGQTVPPFAPPGYETDLGAPSTAVSRMSSLPPAPQG
ncbi:MAG: mechanosensitive ion channel family protein [Janthinobacterium lividum]